MPKLINLFVAGLALIGAQQNPAVYQPMLKLAGCFGNHMVLQRGSNVPLWGWSEPGRKVTVSFRGQSVQAEVDRTGKWTATLSPLTPGGPDELGVYDDTDELIVTDVMVGDVWLCSGQSNMAWPVSDSAEAKDAISIAPPSSIRVLKVPFVASDEPRSSIRAAWQVATTRTVPNFSAVGYFFARSLQGSEKLPIGIIDASWGGSPGEAWMTRSSIFAEPLLKSMQDHYERAKVQNRSKILEYQRLRWKHRPDAHQDAGNRGFALGYHSPKFNDEHWGDAPVPGMWEDTVANMDIDGAVWYRRTVNVPITFAGYGLTISLGQIADYDTVYWNGNRVGQMSTSETAPGEIKRIYTVPGRMVQAGENTIAVRVFNRGGKGGFAGEDSDLFVRSDNSTTPISLAGTWRIGIEKALDPNSIRQLEIPYGPGHPAAPSNLYNGMVAPIVPMALAGFVWYQGEANVGRAQQYETILLRLIQGWRNAFNQGDLPFLITQLPSFRPKANEPGDAEWAEIRECQMKALKLPRVGLAVTLDLGDPDDIHPKRKKEVGERLAEAARQLAYFSTARGMPPIYDGFRREGDKIRVLFRNTAGSMRALDGQPLRGFAVAGEDRKWLWASAAVEGESVLVWSPLVKNPIAVRYAWADNPDGNLGNRAQMMASPFRTDDWPAMLVRNTGTSRPALGLPVQARKGAEKVQNSRQ